MHLANLSDQPGGDPFGDLPDSFAGVALIAHLRNDFIFPGSFGERAGFEHGMGDRLLNVNMLTRPHAFHGDISVGVVWRSNDDRIDVFLLLQHLAEVGKERGFGLCLDRADAALQIQVAEGDDVFVGRVAHIASTDAAEADGGDVQFLVRGDRPSGRIQPRAGDGKSCRSHAG